MLDVNKMGALAVLLGDRITDRLAGLSPSAAAILLSLNYGRAATVTELAGIIGISQPTAQRITGGLISRGLIERSPRAGRKAPVELTAEGRKTAERIQQARLDAIEEILNPLNERERKQLGRLTTKLLRAGIHSRARATKTCRLCDHGVCDFRACPLSELQPKA